LALFGHAKASIQAFGAIAEFGINSKDMSMDYVFGMFRRRGVNLVCLLIAQMANQVEEEWDVPEIHGACENAH
jgi:hypothetical protein